MRRKGSRTKRGFTRRRRRIQKGGNLQDLLGGRLAIPRPGVDAPMPNVGGYTGLAGIQQRILGLGSDSFLKNASLEDVKPHKEPGVYIYYHIYCTSATIPIVLSQCQNILFSGLYSACSAIYCGLTGEGRYISEIKSFLNKLGSKFKILAEGPGDKTSERFTLLRMQKTVHPQDKVLYIHSKGVTKPNAENVIWWRMWMEWFLIRDFEERLKDLDNYDTAGCGWMDTSMNHHGKVGPHYAGNFWWARGDYLQRLPTSIGPAYNDPETWILTGTPAPRVKKVDEKRRTHQQMITGNMYKHVVYPKEYVDSS